MEPTIFKFIWRYSKAQQLTLLAITVFSFPFYYYSLDLPKTIINKAIGGSEFPQQILGYEFEQIEFLLTLCCAFLALVLVNGGFKFWINVYRGRMGERMLRRLRYILFSRILRFPLKQFRKVSQGELIAMVTAEVEPLGGYIGEAISLPAYQGGMLITALAFIMIQDPLLGAAAIAFYPIQMYVIPKLQKRVNMLAKQRVQNVRRLSERIGESVNGIQEVHAHDTSGWELINFSKWLGAIFIIRYEIFQRKFFIKFLNNFIAQVTPFMFYSIGGVLVIQGELSMGSLVAVLAAYKDLSPPWKELLTHYQIAMDARIKYDQLIDQFHPAGMLDESLQRSAPDQIPELSGQFEAQNVIVEADGGFKALDGLNARIPLDNSTAILGSSESGRDDLVRMIIRLTSADKGASKIGGQDINGIHEAVFGDKTSYADQSAYVFNGTIRENLLYGLRHRPVTEASYNEEEQELRERFVLEAEQSGNSTDDINAEWVDFTRHGLATEEAVTAHIIDTLDATALKNDLHEFGLQTTIDPKAHPELAEKILEARRELVSRLQDPKLARLIEPFDEAVFNSNMTVAENILMGTPVGDKLDIKDLASSPYMLSVLDKVGIRQLFLETGLKVAEMMIELFQDLPPGHEFFERYSFIQSDDLAEFQTIIRRVQSSSMEAIEEEERARLMELPFMLVPDRHRLGLATDEVKERILEARRMFADDLPEDLLDAIEFYDVNSFNAAASVQDNILFGKISQTRAQAQKQVGEVINDVICELGLEATMINLGLETSVGVGGGRLSAAQRQKLCLARAIIKKPDVLVLNDPINALDPGMQERIIDNVLSKQKGRGLIWVLTRADLAKRFTNAIIMDAGKVIEAGVVSELEQKGNHLPKLLSAGSSA
jgi:putative ABC transport system ATP-binding protein